MKQYRQATPWAQAQEPPPGMEMTTSVPVRPAGFVSDVLVPLAQAAVTGALLAALLTVAAFALARDYIDAKPVAVWAGLALLIMTGAWVPLLIGHHRLLWAWETLTGQDINQDGQIGKPEKRLLRVEHTDGDSMHFVESEWLEIDDDNLSSFAKNVMRGRKLTEAAWGKDKLTFPGGINEFRAFRERCVDVGLIYRVNPDAENSTFDLTVFGRSVFGRIAEDAAHALTHANG